MKKQTYKIGQEIEFIEGFEIKKSYKQGKCSSKKRRYSSYNK